MGIMINGKWHTDASVGGAVQLNGEWVRANSSLRHRLPLKAEAGRYHLYAAWNCPWAHRVLLMRSLLGLEDVISVSMVAPRRTENGWVFEPGYEDGLFGFDHLHEVYARGLADYTGRVTVPLLVDRHTHELVSNESADLVRMLNQSFAHLATKPRDFYPGPLRKDIEAWNELIHKNLNNGVYRAGFAETQESYNAAVDDVFNTLQKLETQLATQSWLLGDELTEADIRLFPTLARFDVAYYSAFKCSRRRLTDYPNLWTYARRFYALPGVRETVNFEIYLKGYFSRSPKRNPLGIIPAMPEISWDL